VSTHPFKLRNTEIKRQLLQNGDDATLPNISDKFNVFNVCSSQQQQQHSAPMQGLTFLQLQSIKTFPSGIQSLPSYCVSFCFCIDLSIDIIIIIIIIIIIVVVVVVVVVIVVVIVVV
jgi:hypothetical protein